MDGWDEYWRAKLDNSIIIYDVGSGKVLGGPEHGIIVKKNNKNGWHVPGGDFTLELDLSNRSLVMEVDNEKIVINGKLPKKYYFRDFEWRLREYSPIVITRGFERKWDFDPSNDTIIKVIVPEIILL